MIPMNHPHYNHVCALMEAYFEGLYHADSQALRNIFHPRLVYACANEHDPIYLDLESYMARIDEREPPAARNEVRNEAILSVTFGNYRMAHVTARMSMMHRDYLDYLTLVREKGKWQIIAKTFTYTLQAP